MFIWYPFQTDKTRRDTNCNGVHKATNKNRPTILHTIQRSVLFHVLFIRSIARLRRLHHQIHHHLTLHLHTHIQHTLPLLPQGTRTKKWDSAYRRTKTDRRQFVDLVLDLRVQVDAFKVPATTTAFAHYTFWNTMKRHQFDLIRFRSHATFRWRHLKYKKKQDESSNKYFQKIQTTAPSSLFITIISIKAAQMTSYGNKYFHHASFWTKTRRNNQFCNE